MATEEELLKVERAQTKRARTTAVVFGILAITAQISLTYAYFQHAALEKVKIKTSIEIESCQVKVAEAEARADAANKKVEQLMIEAQIAWEVAEDANKSNKKK